MTPIKELNKGDVLTFKGLDNLYKAILCTSCYKEKNPHNFIFAALTFDDEYKPSLDDIYKTDFYGIGNIKDDYFQYSPYERERIWKTHPEIKPYSLGSYGLIIWSKDFMKFRDKVELVGNIDIVDNLDKNGSGSLNASDWGFLTDFFTDKYKTILEERGQKTFKLQSIIRD
jgi:hypothetical protein